jgi:hypothetical protein
VFGQRYLKMKKHQLMKIIFTKSFFTNLSHILQALLKIIFKLAAFLGVVHAGHL